MTDARRKKAEALIKELGAILAEVSVLREGERAEVNSILTGLEVEAMTEAGDFIEEAIGALKGAVM